MGKIQDSEGNEPGFVGVFIPREILEADGLTATEVLLYGTIAAFGVRGCYMLAEDIEKRIRCEAATRRKAVAKLEEMGFIETRKQKNGRIFMRSTYGFQGKATKRVAREEIEEAHDEKPAKPRDPKSYGDADVNELLTVWRDATGYDYLNNKLERKCAKIMLNKYGLEKSLGLAERVGAIQGVKYAPSITSPNELCGRYSKLAKLEMFERRQTIDDTAHPIKRPSKLAQMRYTAPDFNWADYENHDNESPEQKAEAIKKAREIFAARGDTGAQIARKAKK